mgnify:CR=1 FL=1
MERQHDGKKRKGETQQYIQLPFLDHSIIYFFFFPVQVSFATELMQELKFVAKFHGSKKPVRKRNSTVDELSEQSSTDNVNFDWYENDTKKNSMH